MKSTPTIFPLLAALCISQCACTWMDHLSNDSLRRELIEQSSGGLALARIPWDGKAFDVRFFDGRTANVDLACCDRFEAQTIARNRVVLVDLTPAPILDFTKLVSDPNAWSAAAIAQGGPVVVMDEQGRVLERSEVNIHASILSLSPDEKTIAFVGARRGDENWGLFLAGFRGQAIQRLLPATSPLLDYGVRRVAGLEWSPDGRSLLYAGAEGIQLLNTQTRESQKIADGGVAQWSPSGDWISYITLRGEGVLLNVATREEKMIDPGYEVLGPLEWSPDGKYLLILEGRGSHVPYGMRWAYRISDSAYVPLRDQGVGGPLPHWIRLARLSRNQ